MRRLTLARQFLFLRHHAGLFVECLADLEKNMRSKSTPEQLVGSLADRTPNAAGVTAHHLDVAALRSEPGGRFDLSRDARKALRRGRQGRPAGATRKA